MDTVIDTIELVVKEEAAPVLVIDAPHGTDPVDVARSLSIPVVGELSNRTTLADWERFAQWAKIIREAKEDAPSSGDTAL